MNDNKTLFKRHMDNLDRHERTARRLSMLATGMAIGLTVGAFASSGIFMGISVAAAFMCGVVAQRI